MIRGQMREWESDDDSASATSNVPACLHVQNTSRVWVMDLVIEKTHAPNTA